MAAVDYLLEIEGIKGESQDKKHPGTIEIQSFSWGMSQAGSFATAGGGGAGKVSFQDIHFTTSVNKSSPLLAVHCANGQHIKKATLFVRKAGKEQYDYYTIKLDDILVTSYQSGGHAGGDAIPTDQFSLAFAKIKYEYSEQKSDGSLASATPFTWDLKANHA
jgi:type VI secretion system secreted protein Hcp